MRYFAFILSSVILLESCSGELVKDTRGDKDGFYGAVNNLPDSLITDANKARIYTLPTPLQISSAIKIYGIRYNEELLLPEKQVHYSSSFLKALNLGIQTIDLGYSTVYANPKRGMSYLRNVKSLMEEMGVSNFQNSGIIERFEKNINNPDSLYRLIIEAYEQGHDHFQQNGREGLGLLILTGCYLEGLYLTISVGSSYIEDERYQHLVALQKIYIENLIELLTYYIKADEVKILVAKLSDINNEFNKIVLNYNDPHTKPFSIKEPLTHELIGVIHSKISSLRKEIAG